MSRVSIKRVEELTWDHGPKAPDHGPEADQRSGRCFHHHGSETAPQLYEVMLKPGQVVAPHAHENNEIVYVLAGELHLGSTVLKAGSSISILGETVYGFAAGQEGVHFLNFRPCAEIGTVSVEEIAARRTRKGP